jgi:hypothetical protein
MAVTVRRWPIALVIFALAAPLVAMPTPASAESACVADAADDVEDFSTGAVDVVKPEADILAACVVHDADVLEIAVRVAAPTDPATDPAWADMGAAVGASIDVDGDGQEEFDVNYARFEDGQARAVVFDHDTADERCSADGLFDGTRYRLRIPTSCIGNPAGVEVAAFVFYDASVDEQESTGFFDEVPDRPGFLGPFTTAPDPATDVQRLAGGSRVDTAIAISQDDFPAGTAQSVVLARADAFPDALAAAPLAVAAGGPLLLTNSFALADAVASELRRVLPAGGRVLLSGGPAALSEEVRAEVEALGYTAVRADGDTRYATSVAIARATTPDPDLIVVANGNGFPDALVGGALAGAEGGVSILSDGTELDAAGQAYLAEHPDAEVVAIGAIAAQAVPDAVAIAGADAFATSVAVAEQRFGDEGGVSLASGTNFPDGLAGGAHAGRRGIPLLLSWPDVLPESVATYLGSRSTVDGVVVYGGTSALSHQVEVDATAAIR